MKSLIIPVVALATLAGSAWAQTPTAPNPGATPPAAATPNPPADDDAGGPPPPPPSGPGTMVGGPGGPGGPRGHRPPPPPPSRAAHFHLGRGDTMVDVKCADDEPMKACADIALQLLDHLQSTRN